jgi:Tol biopolymer transport system component/DNA-binding winged helix-turn-helix (wHTH) protein
MNGSFRLGEWLVEPQLNIISHENKTIKVEPKIMQVLICLTEHAGQVVAKRDLIAQVWVDTFVTDDVLTRSISELRKIFGDDPKGSRYIQTIPKRGYRLVAPVLSNGTEPFEARQKLEGPPSTNDRRNSRVRKVTIGVVVVLLTVGGALALYFANRSSQAALAPMKVVPFTSYQGGEWDAAFSPDGNSIAFVWNGEKSDNPDIYVKSINAESPIRLTTDASRDFNPTWSPDGQIAFIRTSGSEFEVFTVPVLGNGPERKLFSLGQNANFEWTPHLDWSGDGKYLAYTEKISLQAKTGIALFSPDTGERRTLTSPPEDSYLDNFFSFSPDGRSLAFVRMNTPVTADLYVVQVTGGDPKRLTFDNAEFAGIAWSSDGREIIFSCDRAQTPGLWRIPASGGTPEHLQMGGDIAGSFAVSRRGNRLAYIERCESDTNIYRVDLSSLPDQQPAPTRLIASTRLDNNPKISPDGQKIAFESNRSGKFEIWLCDIDGGNPIQLTSMGSAGSPSWSHDGKQIAFDSHKDGKGDLYVIDADGRFPRRLTTESSEDDVPRWSTDDKWIYFASDRSGGFQVWKLPSKGGEAVQVTKKGGFICSESPDGKFLYYNKMFSEHGIWRATVNGSDETKILKGDYGGQWAVVSDGIYYIDLSLNPAPAIEFLSFTRHQTETIARLGHAQIHLMSLAVSPDRRWILYSQWASKPGGTDIKLVENFR